MVSGIPVPELHLISADPDQVIWNVCIYMYTCIQSWLPVWTAAVESSEVQL